MITRYRWESRETPAEEEVGARPVINEDVLSMLACPACKTLVQLDGQHMVCRGCGRRHPIRDGIPVMRLDEAQQGSVDGPSDQGGPSSLSPR